MGETSFTTKWWGMGGEKRKEVVSMSSLGWKKHVVHFILTLSLQRNIDQEGWE